MLTRTWDPRTQVTRPRPWRIKAKDLGPKTKAKD